MVASLHDAGRMRGPKVLTRKKIDPAQERKAKDVQILRMRPEGASGLGDVTVRLCRTRRSREAPPRLSSEPIAGPS